LNNFFAYLIVYYFIILVEIGFTIDLLVLGKVLNSLRGNYFSSSILFALYFSQIKSVWRLPEAIEMANILLILVEAGILIRSAKGFRFILSSTIKVASLSSLGIISDSWEAYDFSIICKGKRYRFRSIKVT